MAYIVIENTPGYLPESDPAEFDTWDQAVDYANELGNQLEYEGYGLWRAETIGRHYEIIAERFSDELGRVIQVFRKEFDDNS